jgi:hypothetical protein
MLVGQSCWWGSHAGGAVVLVGQSCWCGTRRQTTFDESPLRMRQLPPTKARGLVAAHPQVSATDHQALPRKPQPPLGPLTAPFAAIFRAASSSASIARPQDLRSHRTHIPAGPTFPQDLHSTSEPFRFLRSQYPHEVRLYGDGPGPGFDGRYLGPVPPRWFGRTGPKNRLV